jgi:hypothetical protein
MRPEVIEHLRANRRLCFEHQERRPAATVSFLLLRYNWSVPISRRYSAFYREAANWACGLMQLWGRDRTNDLPSYQDIRNANSAYTTTEGGRHGLSSDCRQFRGY